VTTGPFDPKVLRVASVRTAIEGGLLPKLVDRYEKETGTRVVVSTGEMVYSRAREGAIDLVISHFGHKEAEQFILDGRGEFPRTVFSNQMALIGPANDPAGIRGLDDAGEAFKRIAATKSPYVLNDLDGVKYLTEILWNAAGKPARAGWFVDEEVMRGGAVARATELGAYMLWGLTPFMRDTKGKSPLEPLVLADPLLQRMLVSVIVKQANVEGARAFQNFLLSPVTQAEIRNTKYTGAERVAWVAGGRHNRTAILPKG
jgi:tungstate transport system substrate-binding protein